MKLFTVDHANRTLPLVRRIVEDVVREHQRWQETIAELDVLVVEARTDLPDPRIVALERRAQEIARASNRSVEEVLVESLALLFGTLPDADTAPDALKGYSDEQLWAVVHQHLAWPQDARLRELVALGKQGQVSDEEKAELGRLIDLVDRYMLLRSQALVLLKQRGYEVEKQLKLGA